jgi:hypothetical protein
MFSSNHDACTDLIRGFHCPPINEQLMVLTYKRYTVLSRHVYIVYTLNQPLVMSSLTNYSLCMNTHSAIGCLRLSIV